ncbi:MAG: sigma-E processing peptidase SpoIIGA [Clostridia bacterium]|nr:sigma-E processing peptidase SpoIIGA [Clostridia bacterium]
MIVYIEYVILDNFVFTLLICYISYKIMRESAKMGRCIVATVVGTAIAVLYPFVKNMFWAVAVKVGLYCLMCVILYIKLPKFFLRSSVFLLSTALVGGVQFMLGFAVYGDAVKALTYPISELPLSLFFMPPLILFLVGRTILARLNAHRLRQNFIYEVRLNTGENSIRVRALVDTGNSVKAKRDVVFVSSVTALELLGSSFLKVVTRKGNSMVIHTASGNKKIVLFDAKMELYLSKDEHIFMDVQVGISDIKHCDYEAILPLSVLGKERIL